MFPAHVSYNCYLCSSSSSLFLGVAALWPPRAVCCQDEPGPAAFFAAGLNIPRISPISPTRTTISEELTGTQGLLQATRTSMAVSSRDDGAGGGSHRCGGGDATGNAQLGSLRNRG